MLRCDIGMGMWGLLRVIKKLSEFNLIGQTRIHHRPVLDEAFLGDGLAFFRQVDLVASKHVHNSVRGSDQSAKMEYDHIYLFYVRH